MDYRMIVSDMQHSLQVCSIYHLPLINPHFTILQFTVTPFLHIIIYARLPRPHTLPCAKQHIPSENHPLILAHGMVKSYLSL